MTGLIDLQRSEVLLELAGHGWPLQHSRLVEKMAKKGWVRQRGEWLGLPLYRITNRGRDVLMKGWID
jgi:hypothetical protein